MSLKWRGRIREDPSLTLSVAFWNSLSPSLSFSHSTSVSPSVFLSLSLPLPLPSLSSISSSGLSPVPSRSAPVIIDSPLRAEPNPVPIQCFNSHHHTHTHTQQTLTVNRTHCDYGRMPVSVPNLFPPLELMVIRGRSSINEWRPNVQDDGEVGDISISRSNQILLSLPLPPPTHLLPL